MTPELIQWCVDGWAEVARQRVERGGAPFMRHPSVITRWFAGMLWPRWS